MVEVLAKPVTLVVAVLSVATFFVSLGASGVMLAFSIIGLLYLLAAPLAYIYVEWEKNENHRLGFNAYFLGAAGIVCWVALLLFAVLGANLERFGLFPLLGMAAAVLAVVLISAVFALNYKRRHKSCPECMNAVHVEARICHFCSFRFLPRVPPES